MTLTFETPPQRILIIKPSAIGDVVHALPVLGLLRRRWPDAQISWLVAPPCAALLEGHPDVHEVIRFERRRFGRGWWNPASLVDLARFAAGLRRRRFDLVIDLQGLSRSSLMAWKTAAPVRIGFSNAREWGWMLYTHRVQTTWEPHAVERYLKVAQALGCDPGPLEFKFTVSSAARESAARLLGETLPGGKPYAVLFPGATWRTKRWPVENFAALVGPLRERLGLETVVAGGRQDMELAGRIAAPNLAGRTDLAQLVALLEGASLVIANDSGPMHIAAALGRPLVALFGPTNAVRTGPFGRMDSVISLDIPCRPCYARHCSHKSCLRLLQIEPVLKLAEEQVRQARAG